LLEEEELANAEANDAADEVKAQSLDLLSEILMHSVIHRPSPQFSPHV